MPPPVSSRAAVTDEQNWRLVGWGGVGWGVVCCGVVWCPAVEWADGIQSRQLLTTRRLGNGRPSAS